MKMYKIKKALLRLKTVHVSMIPYYPHYIIYKTHVTNVFCSLTIDLINVSHHPLLYLHFFFQTLSTQTDTKTCLISVHEKNLFENNILQFNYISNTKSHEIGMFYIQEKYLLFVMFFVLKMIFYYEAHITQTKL